MVTAKENKEKFAYPKTCIFQDRDESPHGKLTEQHVLGERLRKLFGGEHRTERSRTHWPDSPVPTPATIVKQIKQGSILTHRIKAVCGACNNGWMREVEERANRTLENLILGRQCLIDAANQENLAMWAIQTTIIGESKFAERHIELEHRNSFRHKRPPSEERWLVRIGRYVGPRFLEQQLLGLPERKQLWLGGETLPTTNVVFNHIVLGRLFLEVVYSSIVDVRSLVAPQTLWSGLHNIFPARGMPLAWAPVIPIDEKKLVNMMYAAKTIFGLVEMPFLLPH